jgi:hypothetical protein
MMIYKVYTINQLTCMTNKPQPKKILNFQTCFLWSKSLKMPENWINREIESVGTNPPEQGMLPSGLQTLPYHMGYMHNLAFKIQEDTTLQI